VMKLKIFSRNVFIMHLNMVNKLIHFFNNNNPCIYSNLRTILISSIILFTINTYHQYYIYVIFFIVKISVTNIFILYIHFYLIFLLSMSSNIYYIYTVNKIQNTQF